MGKFEWDWKISTCVGSFHCSLLLESFWALLLYYKEWSTDFTVIQFFHFFWKTSVQLSESLSFLHEMHWDITYTAFSYIWGVRYTYSLTHSLQIFFLANWYHFHRIDIKLTNNRSLHVFPCRYHLKQMKFVKAYWVKMKLTRNWATVNINFSFDNYLLLLCVIPVLLCGLQEFTFIYCRDRLFNGPANNLDFNFN